MNDNLTITATPSPPHSFSSVKYKLSPAQFQTLCVTSEILFRHRAVLLYEKTGSGKTYIAAALAAVYQKDLSSYCHVIAPANLLATWKNVIESFGIQATYHSYQAASLNSIPAPKKDDDLWLIDEAHFLKNSATKRYRYIQKLTARHRICLITATPISMGFNDLYALMSLCGLPPCFHPSDDAWLKAFAISITPSFHSSPLSTDHPLHNNTFTLNYNLDQNILKSFLNTLKQIHWLTIMNTGDLDGVRLMPHILLHRLLSHRASCLTTLKKMYRYYNACKMHSTVKMLTRREFHDLMGCDGRQMLLPFQENIFGKSLSLENRSALVQDLQFLKSAISTLEDLCRTNDDKLEKIREIIDDTPDQQHIIFTQYADTAIYLSQNLNTSKPTALLTAKHAKYKSYDISPEIILAMFDPNQKLPDWWTETQLPIANTLICSDAFSCGHNFQKASIIIDFDMPWNPTTLHQREGRLLRIGQLNPDVDIYSAMLLNAPDDLNTFQNSMIEKLNSRNHLQNTWINNGIPQLQTTKILQITESSLPEFWAHYANTWIPVDKLALPAVPPNATVQTTTLADAFAPAIKSVQSLLKPLWKQLKSSQFTPNIASDLKSIAYYAFNLAIYPQLKNAEFHSFTPDHSYSKSSHLQSMPLNSIPSPVCQCKIITLYPHSTHRLSTVTHKLSTGWEQYPHTHSPLIHVNTES